MIMHTYVYIKSTTIPCIHLSISFMFIDIYRLFPRPSTESASGSWSKGQLFCLTCWRLTSIDLHLFQIIRRTSEEALSDEDVDSRPFILIGR